MSGPYNPTVANNERSQIIPEIQQHKKNGNERHPCSFTATQYKCVFQFINRYTHAGMLYIKLMNTGGARLLEWYGPR